jgi:rifampicin phosphotransferase
MSAKDEEEYGPIQAPDDFPVVWANPQDAALLWTRDLTHFADCLPPLEADYWRLAWNGIGEIAAKGNGTQRPRMESINGYLYMAQEPLEGLSAEETETRKKAQEQETEAQLTAMATLWEEQWMPQIRAHMAFWDEFDLQGADMGSLVAHLEGTRDRLGPLWDLHFQIVRAAYGAMNKLNDYYKELFADHKPFDAPRLYQGFDNLTLAMGRAQWDLSRQVKDSPGLSKIFAENDVADIPTALKAAPEGADFGAALAAYLTTYGQRGDMWGIRFKSWIEDPSPVLRNIKDYLGDNRDPRQGLAALAAQRQEAIEGVRAHLQGYPQKSADEFERLLKLAETGVVLSEDHGFWIDFTCSYKVRRLLMRFGQHFVRSGAIEAAEDVFYFTFDELIEKSAALEGIDLKPLVAQRQAEIARFERLDPPSALGTKKKPEKVDKQEEEKQKKNQAEEKEKPEDTPGVIRGNSGSPGKARGPARVLRSFEEGYRLQPGEVMVVRSTAPSWTPLFGKAAAVVMEVGGLLSHCAVVAREYQIPGVIGVKSATTKIRDGQILEVDGDEGTVRLV